MINSPYSLKKNKKYNILKNDIHKLISFHLSKCKIFSSYLINLNLFKNKNLSLKDIPFLPVSAFKDFDLFSIKKNNIYKVITSSGTSSNNPSKIYLDKENSLLQIKTLYSIGSEFLGNKRLPMLVIDNMNSINNPKYYTARTAGILGFSIFSSTRTFVLDENLKLKKEVLKKFLNEYKKQKFIIFGFTYLIWTFFNSILDKETSVLFKNAILINGGGWKRLESNKVTDKKFKKFLKDKFYIQNVYNYYGMVEQIGSVFIECKKGYFHTSNFNDIIIRDKNLNIEENNKVGIVQLISSIPTSYPGNSILTEDLGVIYGEDNCKCGKNGKIFKIKGRIEKSIIRGCSDVI